MLFLVLLLTEQLQLMKSHFPEGDLQPCGSSESLLQLLKTELGWLLGATLAFQVGYK